MLLPSIEYIYTHILFLNTFLNIHIYLHKFIIKDTLHLITSLSLYRQVLIHLNMYMYKYAYAGIYPHLLLTVTFVHTSYKHLCNILNKT